MSTSYFILIHFSTHLKKNIGQIESSIIFLNFPGWKYQTHLEQTKT